MIEGKNRQTTAIAQLCESTVDLRDEVKQLAAELARAQSRECVMREALNEAWPMIAYFTDGTSRRLTAQLRAARESSGPCPHATEVERLKFEIDALNGKPEAVHIGAQAALAAVKQVTEIKAEVERLRKLCGRAARYIDGVPNKGQAGKDFMAELKAAAEGRKG